MTNSSLSTQHIVPLIHTIREQRVIFAADLANLFGVKTKQLNQQVKRNLEKFPADFMFQLTADEADASRSQIVTLKKGHNIKYRPYVFTEHGAIMAANVLNSPQAVAMSVYVVRAFVQQREVLVANETILKRLAEIDKTLLQHNTALRDVYQKLLPLLQPPPDPPRPKIGFREPKAKYGRKEPRSKLRGIFGGTTSRSSADAQERVPPEEPKPKQASKN
jgi:hypothetical protein